MKRVIIFLLFISIFATLIACSLDKLPIKPNPTHVPTITNLDTYQSTILPTNTKKLEIQGLIGYIVPPYPNGVEPGVELLIGLSDEEWGLESLSINDVHYLALEKLMSRNDMGEVLWKIYDLVRIPILSANEAVIPSGCMINNKIDDEVFVIALLDSESNFIRFVENKNVLKAWRAERDIGKFLEIDTANITCYSDLAFTFNKIIPSLTPTP